MDYDAEAARNKQDDLEEEYRRERGMPMFAANKTKTTDITVIQTGHFAFEEWSVREGDQNAHYSVTFRGQGSRERAEAEAQRMRDALPKLRFTVEPCWGEFVVRDSKRPNSYVSEPHRLSQREFPGLVQHICDWLNEQSS